MDIFSFSTNNNEWNDTTSVATHMSGSNMNVSQPVFYNNGGFGHGNRFIRLDQNSLPFFIPNDNTAYLIANNNNNSAGSFNQLENTGSEVYFYSQQLQQQLKQNSMIVLPDYSKLQNRNYVNFNQQLMPASTPNSMSSLSSESSIYRAHQPSESNSSISSTTSFGRPSIDNLLPIQACQPQQQYIPSSTRSIQFPIFAEEFFTNATEGNSEIIKNEDDLSNYNTLAFEEINNANTSCSSSPTKPVSKLSHIRRASISTFASPASLTSSTPSTPESVSSSITKRSRRSSKKSRPTARKCHICKKTIRRDISRHLRTHEPVSRFQCVFPHQFCRHRTGQFNRPYDFKKHLLNSHFKFDDPNIKKLHNLNDKLDHIGTCSCGLKFRAAAWLKDHILTDIQLLRCPYVANTCEME